MGKELVICDSNIIIDLLRSNPKTISELNSIGFENVIISSITLVELLNGSRSKRDYLSIEKRISNFNIIHFNDDISKLIESYSRKFSLHFHLQIPDLIIGATAVYYDLKLFTHNKKDFRFLPGINLY